MCISAYFREEMLIWRLAEVSLNPKPWVTSLAGDVVWVGSRVGFRKVEDLGWGALGLPGICASVA